MTAQAILGAALARGVGCTGRAQGRTLRALAHLLDQAAAGRRVIYVTAARAEAHRCFRIAADLAAAAEAGATVERDRMSIEVGRGCLMVRYVDQAHAARRPGAVVVRDHALAWSAARDAGWPCPME